MKHPLLLTLSLFALFATAQQPISNFQGILPLGSGNGDGTSLRYYLRGIPAIPVDQTPQGANATWDFSGVTFNIDHHDYSNLVPNAQSVMDYPGCNFQTQIVEDTPDETANIYATYTDGAFSILRADGEIMTLDYTINSAFIGQFPMDYGYVSSDVVAGNFTYDGSLGVFQGTFSGTVDSSFDGYGSLAYSNDSDQTTSTLVSRLKTSQTISISAPFFPNAGTLTQVSHYYYSEDEFGTWPYIRSIETHLTIPLLGIDESMLVLEKGTDVFLANQDAAISSLSVYPNPASGILNVNSPNPITSLEVFSTDGKRINKVFGKTIDISGLTNGLYLVAIETNSGIVFKKFIKN